MAKIGKNLDDLLDGNRSQILRYMVRNNGCSRVEIAKTIGLKQASITKIVRSLINAEVIRETGFTEGLKGRRSIGLSVNHTKYRIIGMKLSWQGLKTCLFDLQGNQYEKVINYTIEYLTLKNITEVIEKMADNIKDIQSQCPNVIAVGIALPGPFHRDTGTLLLHTEFADRFYPIKEILCKKVSLPIFFEHDATAGALAYWWFKTNCNTKQTLLHLLVSEGVGGGIVSNGQIFSGRHGFSTELGHIIIDYKGKKCVCGAHGCLNAYCRS
ncbi:MAG: ROK family transcriptional regulator, partial [Prevotella sp.]|nr:ROK family transcriptional regulator [Prevotella sp.]